ncbi:MAG: ArsI/CadI family heavy metal resistance metalloenzyme [Casimicrobiaceae bacterium]
MKRFHVHLGVPDLAASVRFYSDLFGMPPSVEKLDYAKWMLEDPRVNFAISHRGTRTGLNHLGLQAESAEELAGIRTRFEAADDVGIADEHEVSCCYARGNKHWLNDPQGIAWEAFHTLDSVPLFGDDTTTNVPPTACGTAATQCCAPIAESVAQLPAKRAGCCA